MMPQLTAEQRTAWRNVLIDEVEATSTAARIAKLPRISASLLTVTAVVAVAVAVAAVVTIAPQAEPERAPAVLNAAAEISTGDPVPGPGQYLRVRTRAEYMGMDSAGNAYVSPEVHEMFLPTDPNKPVVRRTTFLRPSIFFGPGGAAFAAREWAQQNPKVAVERVVEPAPTPLPEDPHQILNKLRATENPAGLPINEHLFAQLADILKRPGVPTALRAGAYRALALVPGIIVAEHTVVLDGATGTAFALNGADGIRTEEIVIDPATGRYVGERLVLSRPDGPLPAGTVLELTAVTTSVVPDAPHATSTATPTKQLPR